MSHDSLTLRYGEMLSQENQSKARDRQLCQLINQSVDQLNSLCQAALEVMTSAILHDAHLRLLAGGQWMVDSPDITDDESLFIDGYDLDRLAFVIEWFATGVPPQVLGDQERPFLTASRAEYLRTLSTRLTFFQMTQLH